MKTLSFWKKSVYSALVFFGTLMMLSAGYAVLSSGLTTADKVGSGSGLTASSWNHIIDAIFELDGRTANISSSGGNVGIGGNPGYKLDVNGTVNATSFRWDGSSLTNINASSVPWSGVSGKPTTVSWYGITDISAWAKASTKPSYWFSEITGTVTDTQVPDNITVTNASNVPWSGVSGKPFNWAWQGWQPSWLWGSNDGSNYYVWNPSNFSVNYANTAGSLGGSAVIMRDSDYYSWGSCPAWYSFVGGFSNPAGLGTATLAENFWHIPGHTWWCSK